MQYKHSELTGAIIEAFYDVCNALGHGFLEKVYENALAHELRKRGHAVSQQAAISVQYGGIVAGEYCADLVVDGAVVVELKAVPVRRSGDTDQTSGHQRTISGISVPLLYVQLYYLGG